jgi:hypothetical protein
MAEHEETRKLMEEMRNRMTNGFSEGFAGSNMGPRWRGY